GPHRAGDVVRPRVPNHHRVFRRHPEAAEGDLEDAAIRLRHADVVRDDELVDVAGETAERELVALLVEQVVGDDADARVRTNRGEQIGGAGDHAARREVAAAIGGGDGIDVPIVQRHAQRPEHAPESLTPRLVEVDAAGEYLDVHFLEVDDVMPLEGVEVGARGVDAVHLGQRG